MNRKLTLKDNIALIVVVLLSLSALYYFGVWKPTSETMEKYDVVLLDDQLLLAQGRVQKILQMEKVIKENEGKTNGLIASYNNLQNEIVELNRILANATTYQIDFADATVDGSIVRRNIKITFQTSNYESAKDILESLRDGTYKCLLRNLQMTSANQGLKKTDRVSVSIEATFYETVINSEAVEGLQTYVDNSN